MLNDLQCRTAKPAPAPRKLFDFDGLFLLITPSGSKLWRFKYRIKGKEKLLSFGAYPGVSLAQARAKRDAARSQVSAGIDPSADRQEAKVASATAAANTFEVVAREYIGQHYAGEGAKNLLARVTRHAFPLLGAKPVADITAPDILTVLRRVDAQGLRPTAHRLHADIGRVLRYGIATGRLQRDVSADLRGAIPAAQGAHFAALTSPREVGAMLRSFDAFRGTAVVGAALRLGPLLFVRPSELRSMEWSALQLDSDPPEWRYLISKTDTPHIVSLAPQAVAILRALQPLTGSDRYVFPGARGSGRCMSESALSAALQRLGFNTATEITPHGFRAMARTLLHEVLGFAPEVIEHQLGHAVAGSLGTAYNRTRFLDHRRRMMLRWADYLDELKAGAA